MLDRGEAAFWPYPRGSSGTPRLFTERFAHPDGRARLVAVSVRESARPQASAGELTLVTGRLLEHYQSGAQTRRVPELHDAQPEALASLHPSTAERLGIADGELVELVNARGTVQCRTRITTDIRPDSVFLPFHYGDEQAANLLTSDAVDPISSMPEFKTNVVRLERLAEVGVPA
jgi:assimilatory nitrate reductase catalytic subunit